MLDIGFIKENKEIVADAARKKHIDFDVEKLLKIDAQRRELTQTVDEMRATQNKVTEKIAVTTDVQERDSLIEEMKVLKSDLQNREDKLKKILTKWQALMLQVPNIPDMSVPEGKSDEENQEIRVWGEKSTFSFKPKSHIELMQNLDMLDLERGSKVSGFRGYFLKNAGAQLSFALWRFVSDHFATEHPDYTPMIVPALTRRESFMGTGWIPQNEEDVYKVQDELYLSGTAEVPVMGYYANEVLEGSELPIKILAFSPCFRREAGSYGKDTKGLIRIHEFYKLEQVILCEASHEESVKHHEEINDNAEKIMQALEIPYHVVANCGGDLGLGQVKKYDIESWVPSEGKYRETHSASYFHDFQTRRLNIRYRDKEGKKRYVHSLNATALPTPRPLVPLIENNQQEDGSIAVPKVLQPYMGIEKITAQ